MRTTDPAKTTNNAATLKQPTGTNHFQFRVHQFGLGVGTTGADVCSTGSLYVADEVLGNQSLRCDLGLTRYAGSPQDGHP